VLIALHGFTQCQVGVLGQASSCQHPADCGFRHAHRLGDPGLQLAALAQRHDQQRLGQIDGSRRPAWPGRGVSQRGITACKAAPEPLAQRGWSDGKQVSAFACAQGIDCPRADQFDSTDGRESGTLVIVHSA
jgi:hypothetical protein